MPKLFISIDGVVIKEVQLTKERSTLGRRPYNDIVIDNLAVSGEHAVLEMSGTNVSLLDLNSTNGTYVNGKAVKKQSLQNGDTVEIGKYQLKFVNEGALAKTDKPAGNDAKTSPIESAAETLGQAAVKVMSGPSMGRQVPLIKVVTTIGKPGVAVAAITRRSSGYVIALVEGATKPTLNGRPIGTEAVNMRHGDVIELAGTQMQFVLL